MSRTHRTRGFALAAAALLLLVVIAGFVASGLAAAAGARDRATDRALAQAREALLGYGAERAIDGIVGPGYLPCPDLDDDGWAEPTCGSLNGDSGADQRLGRLPWKTLGLPDLRDGYGERLWYAVSAKHKGLLNCAASRNCVDMTPPAAVGAITVRDGSGALVRDGRVADPTRSDAAALAVVISPGPPLERDGATQRRACAGGDCDAQGRCLPDPPRRAAHCDPAQFLERAASGEDNASFRDVGGGAAARAGNTDGFIQGPIPGAGGGVNDRLAVVAYRDLMPRVMRRVALEAAQCVGLAAAAGRLPAASDECGAAYGRLPAMGPASAHCTLDDEAAVSWWRAWRPYVTYAPAPPACERGVRCLEARADDGTRLAAGKRFAVRVSRRAGECATPRLRCDADGCVEAIVTARAAAADDVVLAFP